MTSHGQTSGVTEGFVRWCYRNEQIIQKQAELQTKERNQLCDILSYLVRDSRQTNSRQKVGEKKTFFAETQSHNLNLGGPYHAILTIEPSQSNLINIT